jgi:hypothetical protein
MLERREYSEAKLQMQMQTLTTNQVALRIIRMRSGIISCFLAVQLALTAPAQNPPAEKLTIAVIEGEGAIHNLRRRVASGPTSGLTVQILDENKRPVEGATVTFTLPSEGAGGSFTQGVVTMATSDAQGRVVLSGFRPNGIAGKMEIRVTASYKGQVAHATITQFNMQVDSAADHKSGHKKIVVILLIAGAAAAGGAVAATHKSSSAPVPAPTVTTIGITPGTGTVGAPQ